MVLRPFRSLERPLVLPARDEAIEVPYLQEHPRRVIPTVALAVQEIIEEAFLNLAAIVGVKVRPVFYTVRFQPFVLACRAYEAFEISARVQALTAPIRRGQERHGHFRPNRRARLVILVVERMRADLVAEVATVVGEFLRRQGFRSADKLAVYARAFSPLARAVLHGLYLHVVPIRPE